MTTAMRARRCHGLMLIAMLAIAGTALAQHPGAHGGAVSHAGAAAGGGPHQHFDTRFSHNHYYFDRGFGVHAPPAGGVGE